MNSENGEALGVKVEVGTLVADTYQLISRLGRGGMGEVWAARHLRLPGKQVAIKFLISAVSPEHYARFRREAEIASSIGHPNIVDVIDFNTLPNGTPYIVLELLKGEPLSARIARGPIPLDEACDIARQIGSALQAVHQSQIVHRDLKPENIYLCPDDTGSLHHVKILDFGISKIRLPESNLRATMGIMGTPLYMSPEQAVGDNELIDARTDIFALGVILYEMLTGRALFFAESLAAVLLKVVSQPLPTLETVLPGTPTSVDAALRRALEKERQARWPTVEGFIEALTGKPLPPRPPSILLDRPVSETASAPSSSQPAVSPETGATSIRATPPPAAPPAVSPDFVATVARPAALPPAALPAQEKGPKGSPIAKAVGAAAVLSLLGILGFVLPGGPKPNVAPGPATPPSPPETVATVERKDPPPAPPAGNPAPPAPPVESEEPPAPPAGQKVPPPTSPAGKSARQRLPPAGESVPKLDGILKEAADQFFQKGESSEAIEKVEHALMTRAVQEPDSAYALLACFYREVGNIGQMNTRIQLIKSPRLKTQVAQLCEKYRNSK